jgi:adenosyl cobinamide kinase/adenosyl cobinamide phosphate guanylyltransferase
VDYIIVDCVGAWVASTLEEMEWNEQGKGITYRAFHFPVIGV